MDDLMRELRVLLGDLAGQDLSAAPAGASWFDLGFDSLFLTQAAAALKNRFGVKITFRQLLEELGSLEAVAAHVHATRPAPTPKTPTVEPGMAARGSVAAGPILALAPLPDLPRGEATKSAGVPAMTGMDRPLTGTVLERVMREQMRVMELQLSLLRESTPNRAGLMAAVGGTEPLAAGGPVLAMGTGPQPVAVAKPAEESASSLSPAPAVQHGPFRPMEKGPKGGLTKQQQAHLDWLMPRYIARTPKSKEYTQRHRRHLADPRAVAGFKQNWKEMVYPIVSTRSSGARIWDLDGNEWVDVTMGFGVGLLGHSPAFITEAVKQQLDQGVEIGPQSPLAGEVAELICEMTGMERVTFCNTGSEAVMAALRICRTVTGRTRVALFSGAYHGTFDEVLVKGATQGGQPRTLPLAPGVAPNLVAAVTVLDYGTAESLAWIREHAGELAAVLVETVQSRHPDLQPREFLQEIRRITEQAETPLIFDEVITGFRCHPGGAQAYFGIRADLATYGKIIGGGMPFGFIAGKAWLMDAFDGGHWQYGDESFPPVGVTFFAGTFVRHPLAMAAARAMLRHLKQHGPELQAGLARRTDRMIGDLNAYFERNSVPLRLEHFTSVWYPHFGPTVKYGSLLYFHLREKGLHIWEGRPCFISTAHTAEDEAFIEQAFKRSIAEMQAGGFLDGTSDPEWQRASGGAAAAGKDSAELPLTEAQREVWVACQMSREAACAFNESCSIRLEGELDIGALERALREVVSRHEALRLVFRRDGGAQEVKATVPVGMNLVDLSELPLAEQNRRVKELQWAEGMRILDLEQGPLFAVQLLRLQKDNHLLLFTVHHIACDGWSYDVVVTELGELYSAFCRQATPDLPPAVPFTRYVEWERQQVESEAGREGAAWWVSQLTPLPEPLDLPWDRPHGSLRSFRGAQVDRRLSRDLLLGLKRAGAGQKTTLYSMVLAGFVALLHRVGGATDLVVGIPVAGQNWMGVERLVGHCANLLPLRLKVEPEGAFHELLAEVKQVVLDAFDRQGTSFGSLVERVQPPRRPGRVPLVPVMFNLDPPLSQIRFQGVRHSISLNPRRCFQFDLGFNLVEDTEGLVVECSYNTDVFDQATIERWLEHYEVLLMAAAREPGVSVQKMALLGPGSRQRVLEEWNNTDAAYDRSATVHGLVSAQARRVPDRVAVEFGAARLTYGELDRRSNEACHRLLAGGVRAGDLVGVCLDRSEKMVIALLAVLKCGAAYVPIDPGFPAERIAAMLEDSRARVLVTERSLEKDLPVSESTRVWVDDWITENPGGPAIELPRTESEALAYVIYTSGSTGRPKGVEITHRALANFLASMRREPGLSEQDAVLALTTISFDIAGLEIFLPLTTGARVVVAPRLAAVDPEAIEALMDVGGITVAQATPTTWRMMLESGWSGRPGLKVLSGGEPMPPDLALRLLGMVREVWNLYGPTETTIWSTVKRLEVGKPVTIGRPIANTQVYVVDAGLEPVPVGVAGELLIGGEGLARGYWNRAELTAERFVAMAAAGGRRVYRTGDLARWRPDGELECLGRSDFQVKVRGHRIELGEIEAALMRQEGVAEAVVVVRDLGPGDRRLLSYVVPRAQGIGGGNNELLVSRLREGLRSSLPDYMVPSAIMVLQHMPKTPNGKTDRLALPLPQAHDGEGKAHQVAPRNPMEEQLLRLWCEVLGVEKLGVCDDFFEAGGHSLLAVTLFARIEKHMGVKLPLATLFQAPTVERLARLLPRPVESVGAWSSLVPIQERGGGTPLFLVHGAGGNVLLYRALSLELGEDRPIYGLQSRGLDGRSNPLGSIEEMAAAYLEEIRRVQPHGPYCLGGYCMGGTVAYEMAQSLLAAGEQVAFVGLLDTYNFANARPSGKLSILLQRLGFHARNLAGLGISELGRYLREKSRLAFDGELRSILGGVARRADNTRAGSPVERSLTEVNEAAAERYRARSYPGRLTIFKPRVNYDFYPDPDMGWGEMAGQGLEVVELPVNPHAMLVQPYVSCLASALRARLDRVVPLPLGTRAA